MQACKFALNAPLNNQYRPMPAAKGSPKPLRTVGLAAAAVAAAGAAAGARQSGRMGACSRSLSRSLLALCLVALVFVILKQQGRGSWGGPRLRLQQLRYLLVLDAGSSGTRMWVPLACLEPLVCLSLKKDSRYPSIHLASPVVSGRSQIDALLHPLTSPRYAYSWRPEPRDPLLPALAAVPPSAAKSKIPRKARVGECHAQLVSRTLRLLHECRDSTFNPRSRGCGSSP